MLCQNTRLANPVRLAAAQHSLAIWTAIAAMSAAALLAPQASLPWRGLRLRGPSWSRRLQSLLGLVAALAGQQAGATAYSFPGNLPAGCSGNSGNYSCAAVSLLYGDTITINSPKPATITVNGDLVLDTCSINASGVPADLTLVVTGVLTPGYQSVVNANLQVGSIAGTNATLASFGGTITATTGNVVLGPQNTVAGTITTTSGGVTLGQGSKASGSFSGSLGAFSAGSAGSSNLAWSEVGRGDLLARLTSGSYLGSGFTAFGASPAAGALWCAAEGGNCALPGGTTATVYFGAGASFAARTGAGGTVACNSAVFGDPIPGTVKLCFYVATAATNGSVGDFIAHHFDVSATAACGAFSYAGQAFATQVSARNAAGATTQNFDGSTSTSPNFAQAVTLQDGVPLGLGAMAGAGVAAGAFVSGVAAATPSYAFTTKTTAKQALTVRASNSVSGAGAISSLGYTEASMGLRSGRLRLSNAFGSAGAVLQIPVVAEYWTGNAWVLNSADSCSTLASANVALSNPRNAAGNTSTATSTAGALTVSNGSGVITLSAPSPANSSLGLDVAINLGSTTSDQSCLANHPGTTGAAKPWLRAQNGACATTADRDPGARASFGIFSPESKKTVHVRDVY